MLLGLDPGTPLAVPSWLPLLAPWVASLGARSSPEPKPQEGGLLLTDGSYFSLAHPGLDRLRELVGNGEEIVGRWSA